MRAKKCPPGVFCIENLSFAFFLILLLVIGYLIYINLKSSKKNDSNTTVVFDTVVPSYPYSNLVPDIGQPGNVYLDPLAPPLNDERYLTVKAVPINISTNVGAVDTNYRQVGIVTPMNGQAQNNILPLMGRPLFTNRNKWQYYTISNQHNNVKLPISVAGKSALNDYGVDQIYTGDTIFVEGYNEPFAVTVYENDTIKYLPVI
jgi:hypothetical protein